MKWRPRFRRGDRSDPSDSTTDIDTVVVVGSDDDRPVGSSSEPPASDVRTADGHSDGVEDAAVLDELSLVFGDDSATHDHERSAGADSSADGGVVATGAAPTPEEGDLTARGPAGAPPAAGPDEAIDDRAATGHQGVIDPGLVPPAIEDAGHTIQTGHTIQIGGEDLPEARYLDEELKSDSESDGPVIIDDDDTADAVVTSDATGRGIDGRIRQRRIRVRRAEGRRRLQWVLVGAVVIVAAIAVVAVLASSLFSVNQITVVGNRYSDPDALKTVILGLDGTPVLLVDTTAVEEELEAIPWVEDARVRTSFPNSASIEIRERTAVAAMPGADGLSRVLDKEGRVLDLIEGQPIALVWISGPVTLDIPAGHFASPGPTWGSALVPKLTPSIRPRVESMQVTPDGADLRIYLRPLRPASTGEAAGEGDTVDEQTTFLDGPLIEVRFGSAIGDNEQIEKLVRLERVLEDIDTKRVSVIDVSTAEVTVL